MTTTVQHLYSLKTFGFILRVIRFLRKMCIVSVGFKVVSFFIELGSDRLGSRTDDSRASGKCINLLAKRQWPDGPGN
jgi:hypothetical protein